MDVFTVTGKDKRQQNMGVWRMEWSVTGFYDAKIQYLP